MDDRRLPGLTRRGLIRVGGAAMVGFGLPAIAAPASLGGLNAAAPGVDPMLRARALAALARHNSAVWSREVIGIVDFGLPSSMPRFHLVDILAGRTISLLVAHGRGSDPDHSGMLQRFSNVEGSLASSEGAYLIGHSYLGKNGLSRRLVGLDPSNDAAEPRAIVIHSAAYVGPDVIASQGKLGRSDGCFAVSLADIARVVTRLRQGRLLYAGRSGAP